MSLLLSGGKGHEGKSVPHRPIFLILSYIIRPLVIFRAGVLYSYKSLLEKHAGLFRSTWLYGLLLGTVVFSVYLIYDYKTKCVFKKNKETVYLPCGHTLHDSLLIDSIRQSKNWLLKRLRY